MLEGEPQGEITRVEYISVEIDPSKVGDPGKCALCGSGMIGVPLNYDMEDEESYLVVKNDRPLPGFKCPECDAEYFDALSTSLPLYQATMGVLPPDLQLRVPLQEAIDSLAGLLPEQSSVPSQQ